MHVCLQEILCQQAKALAGQEKYSAAEALFLQAKQPEGAITMYREKRMFDDVSPPHTSVLEALPKHWLLNCRRFVLPKCTYLGSSLSLATTARETRPVTAALRI